MARSDAAREPPKLVSSSILREDVRRIAATEVGRRLVAPNVNRVAKRRGEVAVRFGGVIGSRDFAGRLVR